MNYVFGGLFGIIVFALAVDCIADACIKVHKAKEQCAK